ncbi:T-cell surface glycoprotein CD5 isoform X3 [Larus michahellis]|uniref:T-cell surface glycoprotein CD5 isoform X3 n=1 Tax=Larus michahellis TaxID=119627 RepID=UPI003D9AFF9A
MLEVKWKGRWNRVCRDNPSETFRGDICQRLGCGPPMAEPLQLVLTGGKEPRNSTLRCQRPVATVTACQWVPANCTEHAVLACGEPPPATPRTTPEPTGPARLQLVDGDSNCLGFLELHREGLWGAVAANPGVSPELATRLCRALGCGTAVDGRGQAEPEPKSHLPVRWEATEPCENRPLFDCFNRTRARRGRTPAFIICSGPEPRALRRLAAGPTPCEGDIEVFHEGQWRVLCDNWAQRTQRGRQLCQELRCGNLSSSAEVQDPPVMGVTCGVPTLHLCPTRLGRPQTCSRTRIVPGLQAASRRHVGRHRREHLPGSPPLRRPLAHLRPSCLQEADEENLQKEAAPVDRAHGTQPDGLLPPQQHRRPQAAGGGAAGAGGGQRLRSAPPEELPPLGLPSPGRCVQSVQPSGQLLRQRLRPSFHPQSVTHTPPPPAPSNQSWDPPPRPPRSPSRAFPPPPHPAR